MINFIGQCTRMSIASLLMCRNSTKFSYTRIIDTTFTIDSSEYINATLAYAMNGSTAYTIHSLLSRSFQPNEVGIRRLSELPINILTLRVAYENSSHAYSEQQLQEGMWGNVNRSVNNILYESSYGTLTFTRNTSQTKTIILQSSNYLDSIRTNGCNIDILLYAANMAAYRESKIDLYSFSHIEYIIPSDFGTTCDSEIGDGVGAIQCSMYECFTVIRSPTVFTRAHEIGHNVGFKHAYGCGLERGECSSLRALEYGDATAIMGGMVSRDTTGGFIAPNRMNAGWLGNITDGAADGRFNIGALASWQTDTSHVVRVTGRCPPVPEIFIGDDCEILLSYRAPVGIDVDIIDGPYSLTVSVHIQSINVRKTLLLVSLRAGDSYQLSTGRVVSVIETNPTHAVVTVCQLSSSADTCDISQTNKGKGWLAWLAVCSMCVSVGIMATCVAFALKHT